MRNSLIFHPSTLQDSPYLEPGIEGIVDQVIGPKILPAIEPQMENIMYKMFGIEKPASEDESPNEEIVEKLSDVSDVEMKSAEEEEPKGGQETDGSSPGPGLRGDMSPLTPEHNLKSQMSPLTPPPGEEPKPPGEEPAPPLAPATPPPPGTQTPPSPRTPPGPPPNLVYEQVEEEIVSDVSPPRGSPETPDDSGMPSPPPPPLPPPPLPPTISASTPPLPPPPESNTPKKRPPSPITSPIDSSSGTYFFFVSKIRPTQFFSLQPMKEKFLHPIFPMLNCQPQRPKKSLAMTLKS